MNITDIMSSADVIKRELNDKATHAATEMLQRIGGDNGACGFAWVTIHPEHKGNTKLGKAERRADAAATVLKSYGLTAYGASRLD